MRYLRPVPPARAEGLVADVYRQVRRDFGTLAAAMTLHSPVPEVLAGAWCCLREILIVGELPRVAKEVVAAAVSRANACPYCVEAHALMVGAAGEGGAATALRRGVLDRRGRGGSGDRPASGEAGVRERPGRPGERSAVAEGPSLTAASLGDAELDAWAAWAEATRRPDDPLLRQPPFGPEHAAEALGTAACFHYVNRMVTAVGEESPLPAPVRGWLAGPVRWLSGRLFAGRVRTSHRPGDSFALFAEPVDPERDLPADLRWPLSDPRVARALAHWWRAVHAAAAAHLPEAALTRTRAHVSAWDGADPPLGTTWLDDATTDLGAAAPAARVILLTALAPHRLTAAEVDAFHHHHPGDPALLAAIAWGAALASTRICAGIAGALRLPMDPL